MLRITGNARIWNKKIFSIQITLVDLASEQTAGINDTNCVESMGKNTHHVPKMVQKGTDTSHSLG